MAISQSPIFCALDTCDSQQALSWAINVKPYVCGFKIGLEFFLRNGAEGYAPIAALGMPVFLDLKLHDIPNTVNGAIGALLPLNPAFVTLHVSGGALMMQTAANKVRDLGEGRRPRLLGVTALTSLDGKDLAAVGQDSDVVRQSLRLAKLAIENGLDGLICAPTEVAVLRAELGDNVILMVPGSRPEWGRSNDQKRVLTPLQTMKAGANYLVLGRPITEATDVAEAAKRIASSIATGEEGGGEYEKTG